MSQQTAGIVWPGSDGTRVPYEIYTSQDVFDREQERVFRGPFWNYVALEAEIPAPGDFRTSFVGDTPVVVSRDREGGLRASGRDGAARGLGQRQ
jgi:anthranilate 1,2-dioxygenase large subunit